MVGELGALIYDEAPDWQRLAELVEFLGFFADRIHHPLEDRLFDRLIDKGLTPGERQMVFKNLRQHQEICALTETMTGQIDQALAGASVDFADFRALADSYLSLQRRHMQFEEGYLFPLLQTRFDQADWRAVMAIVQPKLTGVS